MSGHGDQTTALSITTVQADGSVLTRRWYTCAGCTEVLAAQLGPPVQETLASPEAAASIEAHMETVPGLVNLTPGES